MEACGCHSAKLVHIIGVHCVGVDDGGGTGLLDWLLGYLDAVVDDEQRVVGPQHLVVQGDTVQVLLQK